MFVHDQNDFNYYSNHLINSIPNYDIFISDVSFYRCTANLLRRLNYTSPRELQLINVLYNVSYTYLNYNNLSTIMNLFPDLTYRATIAVRQVWQQSLADDGKYCDVYHDD